MENVSVGATLFVFGLFKKVFLADGIAPLVNSLFDEASGQPISLLPAWIAAFGFTLQIYFDFSGYTDMALGLARLFGVRLPPNFNSPLKSSSIIDFWLRWHMSLTRFLTAYIYNPLVLVITRRRLARGQPAFTANNATVGGFLVLLMFPTMLTMFISGVWHGAGYLFILWGMLHGVFLTLNHAWRLVGKNLWSNRAAYARFMQPTGFVLTLLCVICSMVLFRSPTMGTASSLYRGMLGVNGFAPGSFNIDSGSVLWILALAAIAFGCPNSLQLLDRYDPALGWKQRDSAEKGAARALAWKPSLAWAVALSIITTLAILYLGGPSEFLYWQF
jgi:D-alanyl-lipoteichoic acid acyltransferase DltB (MBOAT superfamily)